MKSVLLIFTLILMSSSLIGQDTLNCDQTDDPAACRLDQSQQAIYAAGGEFPEDEDTKQWETSLALVNALTASMAMGSIGAGNCPALSYQIFLRVAQAQSIFELLWFRGHSSRSRARKEIFDIEMESEKGNYAQTMAFEYLIDETKDAAEFHEKKYQYHTLLTALYAAAGALAVWEITQGSSNCLKSHSNIVAAIDDKKTDDKKPDDKSNKQAEEIVEQKSDGKEVTAATAEEVPKEVVLSKEDQKKADAATAAMTGEESDKSQKNIKEISDKKATGDPSKTYNATETATDDGQASSASDPATAAMTGEETDKSQKNIKEISDKKATGDPSKTYNATETATDPATVTETEVAVTTSVDVENGATTGVATSSEVGVKGDDGGGSFGDSTETTLEQQLEKEVAVKTNVDVENGVTTGVATSSEVGVKGDGGGGSFGDSAETTLEQQLENDGLFITEKTTVDSGNDTLSSDSMAVDNESPNITQDEKIEQIRSEAIEQGKASTARTKKYRSDIDSISEDIAAGNPVKKTAYAEVVLQKELEELDLEIKQHAGGSSDKYDKLVAQRNDVHSQLTTARLDETILQADSSGQRVEMKKTLQDLEVAKKEAVNVRESLRNTDSPGWISAGDKLEKASTDVLNIEKEIKSVKSEYKALGYNEVDNLSELVKKENWDNSINKDDALLNQANDPLRITYSKSEREKLEIVNLNATTNYNKLQVEYDNNNSQVSIKNVRDAYKTQFDSNVTLTKAKFASKSNFTVPDVETQTKYNEIVVSTKSSIDSYYNAKINDPTNIKLHTELGITLTYWTTKKNLLEKEMLDFGFYKSPTLSK